MQVEVHQIILHLMRPNDNRRRRIGTTVHKPQARNVVVYVHHGILPKQIPLHLPALKHQRNLRHLQSHPPNRQILLLVTAPERRHRRRLLYLLHRFTALESPHQRSVDRAVENRVRIDRADRRAADPGPTELQQRRIDRNRRFRHEDRGDSDEVGRDLGSGDVGGSGALVILHQPRVLESRRVIDSVRDDVRGGAEEQDAVGIRIRRQAEGEFAAEGAAEGGRDLRREANSLAGEA
ncbi:unnamed protein product, partial [Linum tenue]